MTRPDLDPPAASPPLRRPARERPDARPARLMMGAGALAALTVAGAGLVSFPPAVADGQPTEPATAKPTSKVVNQRRPVRYIHLKRGQKAPKGATVIQKKASKPRVVVQRVVVSAPSRSQTTLPRRTVVRTRQSGR